MKDLSRRPVQQLLQAQKVLTLEFFIRNASVNSSCVLPPPPFPGQMWSICPSCQSRGWALANLARPGGWAFANPGDNPEKFVDVFKGMFS